MVGPTKTGKPRQDEKPAAKTQAMIPAAMAAPPLARTLGNQAMLFLDKREPAMANTGAPRIALKRFSPDRGGGGAGPDKSIFQSHGDQDQNASLTSFATEAQGVGIEVEIVNAAPSSSYPDGYHWTQTIDTNVPLGGTTSPYVDPRPNDDTKPFYYNDAEAAAYPTTFIDHPSRIPPLIGVTTWDATLALNGVNGTTVTRLDALRYGFSIDMAGTVTARNPTSPGSGLLATHRSTLSSEFPGWTFT